MTGVPLNIDWQQILLHLFNFTILFGALYILLYKPVKDFMDKRTAYYEDMNTEAENKLAEAENSRVALDEKVRNFDEEMREEKARINKEIEEKRQKQLDEAKADAEKIVSDARAQAERTKEDIIASAQTEITQLVTGAIEKLTPEQSSAEAFDQFLDSVDVEDK